MNRPLFALILCFVLVSAKAQQERLPADLRQHNLTSYNASLFNPAFSLDRNNPESVAFWARWQWQGIDADPSTLFLNYTRKLNNRSAAGAGFFQHNTGIFFNTGAALNYAYKFELNPRVRLSVGANLFGFVQELADDRFQVDPNLPIPIATETNDFILQMAPGVSLEVERLSLSLASENLVDYNFRAKEGNTAKEDKIFMSLLSYDFPIALGSATNAFLRPSMYLRTIPGQSNQVGFYTHLNTDGYYGQIGYNNFYGFAIGGGYTFFDRVTVGALMEVGTGASIIKETSFELMASYFLGTPDERHKMVGHDLDENGVNVLDEIEDMLKTDKDKKEKKKEEGELVEEDAIEEELEKEKAVQEELEKENAAAQKEMEQQKREAEKLKREEAKRQEKREKMVQDSLAKVEKEVAAAARKEQKRLDREAAELAKEKEAESKISKAEAEQMEKTRKEDSIRKAKEIEAAAIKREQQRKIDSVAQARAAAIRAAKKAEEAEAAMKEDVTPEAGERYEEVRTAAGLLPGYYLIANVFATDKYYQAFMNDLARKGLQPKSFRRTTDGYSYVYLKRYKTLVEAREARDSNFDGKYAGDTWVFRVRGR